MTLLDVYHRLPYPLKVVAASARGAYLRRWRYGPETDAAAAAALAREGWDTERWREWREQRLPALLERAATRVPYYRRHWRGRGATGGSGAPWRELRRWPVLGKEALRADPRAFLADDVDPRRMFVEHTSGSTGTPLTLYWSHATTRAWYALFEARVRGWNDVRRRDRWANIGGQLVTDVDRERPPFWVWNAALRQLYLSSYHLRPENAGIYLEALRRHRVRYLLGYPSALAALARAALDRELEAPRMTVAIANAEPLSDHQREAITGVFRCPVRDTYGMAEIACAASECAAGRLHLWPEVGVVEILALDRDEPVEPGVRGRVVATGLLNPDMPLVRYDTGDLAVAADDDSPCACGRRLPVLHAIEGRRDDLIHTPDGRAVGRMDPVFKTDFPIREAQIAQTARDRVEIRVVPAAGYDDACAAELARRVRQRLGDGMEVEVRPVEALERTAAGKLRAVVNEMSSSHGES